MCAMQITQNGVIWVFMPMIIQFLEAKCEIKFADAKNMLVLLPFISIFVIFGTMLIAYKIKNETKILFVSACI